MKTLTHAQIAVVTNNPRMESLDSLGRNRWQATYNLDGRTVATPQRSKHGALCELALAFNVITLAEYDALNN